MMSNYPDNICMFADHPASPVYRNGARDDATCDAIDTDIGCADRIRGILTLAQIEIANVQRAMKSDVAEDVSVDLSDLIQSVPDDRTIRDHYAAQAEARARDYPEHHR